MKNTIVELLLVFVIFFMGTAGVLILDNICMETTGAGGKLVLHVDN